MTRDKVTIRLCNKGDKETTEETSDKGVGNQNEGAGDKRTTSRTKEENNKQNSTEQTKPGEKDGLARQGGRRKGENRRGSRCERRRQSAGHAKDSRSRGRCRGTRGDRCEGGGGGNRHEGSRGERRGQSAGHARDSKSRGWRRGTRRDRRRAGDRWGGGGWGGGGVGWGGETRTTRGEVGSTGEGAGAATKGREGGGG